MSTVPDAAREPHAPQGAHAARAFGDAVQGWLDRRHAQRASPTFGDEADAALLDALARLGAGDLALAALPREGARIGREVLARRCFEDSLPGALAILSSTTLASGWGVFALEGWFHRSAHVAFTPHGRAAHVGEPALAPFVGGLLEGYFGEAFNCRAAARAEGGLRFVLDLHEGRDVNQRRWRP